MVSLILVLGMLGLQSPSVRIAEARLTINRFDDMDKIAISAKVRELGPSVTSAQVEEFAHTKLGTPLPLQQAEKDMIANIIADTPKPVKTQTANRGWYYTSYGWIWGWTENGVIRYYAAEQPR